MPWKTLPSGVRVLVKDKPTVATQKVSSSAVTGAPAKTSKGTWLWPTLSQRLTTKVEPGHVAYDIGALSVGRSGDRVSSPTFGTIEKLSISDAGYGNAILIRAASGEEIVLGHLAAFNKNLKVGDVVRPGQMVGAMGSSGDSTGPHLHFEIRSAGGSSSILKNTRSAVSAVDPAPYFSALQNPQLGRVDVSSLTFPGAASSLGVVEKPVVASSTKVKTTPPTPRKGSGTATSTTKTPDTTSTTKASDAVTETPSKDDLTLWKTPLGNVTVKKKTVTTVIVVIAALVVGMMGLNAMFTHAVEHGVDKTVDVTNKVLNTAGKAKKLLPGGKLL